MLLNQFDIAAAMPTYPNNNIQQTKNNPFNENMKDQTGVILIHILLYLQSSQHQQNTYHQTGYCSDILQLSILFTQIKKIYIQIIAWTQVIILHIQQFYQGSIVLPECVHSSLARGEFKDVIVCYVWELIHWWDSILLPQRRQGTSYIRIELLVGTNYSQPMISSV